MAGTSRTCTFECKHTHREWKKKCWVGGGTTRVHEFAVHSLIALWFSSSSFHFSPSFVQHCHPLPLLLFSLLIHFIHFQPTEYTQNTQRQKNRDTKNRRERERERELLARGNWEREGENITRQANGDVQTKGKTKGKKIDKQTLVLWITSLKTVLSECECLCVFVCVCGLRFVAREEKAEEKQTTRKKVWCVHNQWLRERESE